MITIKLHSISCLECPLHKHWETEYNSKSLKINVKNMQDSELLNLTYCCLNWKCWKFYENSLTLDDDPATGRNLNLDCCLLSQEQLPQILSNYSALRTHNYCKCSSALQTQNYKCWDCCIWFQKPWCILKP